MPELIEVKRHPGRQFLPRDEFGLTERQRQMVDLIARGYGGAQVRDIMNMTQFSQENMRTKLYKKFRAHNAAHMVAICYDRGILKPKTV